MTNAASWSGSTPRSLALLLDGIATVPREIVVSDITLDSRTAVRGGLFIACRGIKSHGLDYLGRALNAGVGAVLWEPAPGVSEPRLPSGVLALRVPELSRHVGRIADRFFGSPSKQLSVAGITGTNGKTTCAYLLAQAADLSGRSAGYTGTIGYGKPGALTASEHTTSDAVSVHRRLAEFRDKGAGCVAMEVSSHALDQNRVDAVHFHTAVFTNLTHDHLDYHGTLEAYGAAKTRLFGWESLQHCVINIGDDFGRTLAANTAGRKPLTVYGLQRKALDGGPMILGTRELYAREIRLHASGVEIVFDGSWGPGTLRSRLLGAFNAENLLAGLAVLLGWDIPLERASRALEQCVAPPGRLETFAAAGKGLAVVDYAHTPDALGKALITLRRHCQGRLWCVFGCGGDRDPDKRPMMGAIAAELADEIVLTDDNPRTEDPARIVEAIAAGIPHTKQPRIIRDRVRAIEAALAGAQAQDVVLIAGKGHEDYQIYGTESRPFSDRKVVAGLMGAQA